MYRYEQGSCAGERGSIQCIIEGGRVVVAVHVGVPSIFTNGNRVMVTMRILASHILLMEVAQ